MVHFNDIDSKEVDRIEKEKTIEQKFNFKTNLSPSSIYQKHNEGTASTLNVDYQFSSPLLVGTRQGETIQSSDNGFTVMKPGYCLDQSGSMVSLLLGAVFVCISYRNTDKSICNTTRPLVLVKTSQSLVQCLLTVPNFRKCVCH